MSFLAPGFFYASMAVAAAIAALHFIVTRQPRAGVLPTARFVPDMPATATARATRPADIPLMLLRMLLVLAAGAGLAKPVFTPSRTDTARVFLVDVSRSVSDRGAVRDSVKSLHRDGDVILAFDSSARRIERAALDSIAGLAPSSVRGNLTAALLAAIRAGSELRERADSIDLIVVSPLGAEALDAATDSVRRRWPGRARIILAGRTLSPVEVAAPTATGITARAAADDPLNITIARLPASNRATVVRDGSAPANAGEAIVHWPASARPKGAVPRSARDSTGGVVAGDNLVVGLFERRWVYPADSIRGAEVIARWIDGEPAAIEWAGTSGCERSVAVPVTPVGDLVIRSDFIAFAGALTAPCISQRPFISATTAQRASLPGTGRLAPRELFRPRGDAHSWIAPWLLSLALILAVAELFLRRRRLQAIAAANSTPLASAA
jgi:hypothetical protein